MRPSPMWCVGLALAIASIPAPAVAKDRADPWFGEALYFAYQEEFFEALERLDAEIAQHHRVDEPELDSLHPLIGHAEFSVGDFELEYRMHHRAGRAIRAVLEADVPDEIRNDAAFRLARIHFQKGQPEAAMSALDGMRGEVPDAIRDDVAFLRGNLLLALERPGDAVEVLEPLQDSDELRGFSAYNLGIALLQADRPAEALTQLDRAGKVGGSDPTLLAIRDKSNLVLGTLWFEAEQFEQAYRSLDRVRLVGPFSNQALLRAGWADASAGDYRRALVPWGLLAERESTDVAVQEAWLAVAYAYGELGIHGRAAVLYGEAVESYTDELEKIDASIESIRNGEFLEALVREEIRHDKDWVVRLRRLPDAPETFYLTTLMASHEFQTGLQNYLDLEDQRRKLVGWITSLAAFEDLIRQRGGYYDPRLPGVDADFRRLDARLRLRREQYEHLAERLHQLLVQPRPELLATAAEQAATERLEGLEVAIERTGASDEEQAALGLRLSRLRGAIAFRHASEFPARLTAAHEHLRELEQAVEVCNARYDAFVRARQAATHSYVGYGETIHGLRARIGRASRAIDQLMAQQGRHLETVAIRELAQRRLLLETYQNRARFAFADSYDRAAKAQARAELE